MTGIFHQAGVGTFDDFPRIAIGQVHQFQIGHFITPWRLSDSADGISGIGGSQTLGFHATVRRPELPADWTNATGSKISITTKMR